MLMMILLLLMILSMGDKEVNAQKDSTPFIVPKLPYPARFQSAKIYEQFAKFLEVLNRLTINIPFTEAIKQMPSYAKFLK